jgi:hypothetical protein
VRLNSAISTAAIRRTGLLDIRSSLLDIRSSSLVRHFAVGASALLVGSFGDQVGAPCWPKHRADRLWPAGGVDPSVGRVAGGQGVGVVPVAAVDHPDDQGGGHQRSSASGITAG